MFICNKRLLQGLMLVWVMVIGNGANAQECPDLQSYAPAREIVDDLQRIVTPKGVQAQSVEVIGGIPQAVSVRGKDRDQPILLFVHGGPASPLMPAMWQFARPLEDFYLVATWDQRGAGKTYGLSDPKRVQPTLSIDRYTDDLIEVADLLRHRYKKDKVLLVGHSWGTVISIAAIRKRPDLFSAYVGIGQVVSMRENERVSFAFALKTAKARGNAAAVRELEAIAPYPGRQPITRERIVVARKWAQFYGGLSAYRERSNYFFGAPLLAGEYSADDVCSIDRGSQLTLGTLLPSLLEVDYRAIHQLPIPVFMFLGRHDYSTPSEPTAQWLAQLQAPEKAGIWFEHSAHLVPWEEPGKFLVSMTGRILELAQRGAAYRSHQSPH